MLRARIVSCIWLLAAFCSSSSGTDMKCVAEANPPKLPVVRSGGSIGSGRVHVLQLSGLADTWKPTRREVGSVPANTLVEILEDVIVIDSPDIIRVTQPIDDLKLKEGDQILRYAQVGAGNADIWANGCWYEKVNLDFVTEPDGGGCATDQCSARVSKPGHQTWWARIKLPDGKSGWTQVHNLDVPE